jgi:hypothetical protein
VPNDIQYEFATLKVVNMFVALTDGTAELAYGNEFDVHGVPRILQV